MPQDYAASVQGVAIRVTRLDDRGNLLNGPSDSYTTSAFIRTSFTPEYEEGDEITEKAADGTVCVSFKAPDTLKRVNLEIAICEPDPELSALLSGGLMLSGFLGADATKNPPDPGKEQVLGWASAQVGEDPSGNGVAVEVWSRAIQNGKPAGINPFFRWVFPYVKTRLSGDRVIENGLLATTFEGFGLGNINFRSGVDQTWRWPAATDRPYLYAREGWAPTGLRGFYTWDKNNSTTPADYEGVPKAVGDDLNSAVDMIDVLVGTNVPGGANPYPYNPARSADFILGEDDYSTTPIAGAANFPASAAAQNVQNKAPGTPAAQNTVTYKSRQDPLLLDDVQNLVGDITATLFAGRSIPGDIAGLSGTKILMDGQHNQAFTDDEFITLGGGNTGKPVTHAAWDGNAWVAVTLPTGVTAGAPSAFTPVNARVPHTLTGLVALGALGQTTAWTTGQYVVLGDNSHAHWDGNSWVVGDVPAPVTVAITGVAAGAPGSFAPAGATLPADLAALKADPVVGDTGTNKPTGAWTTGQSVKLGDGSDAHWDGNAWAASVAP